MNSTHRVEKGLVLRATPYKDADVMLTILSECSGKLSVIARGARRKGSRIGAAIEPLAYSEFTLYTNGRNFTLNEAEPLELFYNLRSDLEAITLGNYFAEVADYASDSEVVDPYILRLTLNALYALNKKLAPIKLIKAAFQLKIASIAGYQPQVFRCDGCDCFIDGGYFSVANSAIYCAKCANTGTFLDSGIVSAMRYIIGADVKKVFAFKLGDEGLKLLDSVTERYLSYHFDCDFKTLKLYNTIKE